MVWMVKWKKAEMNMKAVHTYKEHKTCIYNKHVLIVVINFVGTQN
jgi:hypothetical protein